MPLPMTSPAQSPRARFAGRPAAWFARWGSIVPLLAAEFIVWLGFGALLPVLPLYFKEQGIDLATLGIVIAAWPAARLIGEPIFGWLADRTARVPLMVVGLVATGIFSALPLVLTGPLAFFVLRGAAGLATALYDPAARGFLTDTTEPARRGEAFGLYGAAQMGGLLFGPAIGAFGAALIGGHGFVFVFGGIAAIVAAVAIALTLRERPPVQRTHPAPGRDHVEFPHGRRGTSNEPPGDAAPASLWNRGLVAVLVLNAGGFFASGTYEVVWSLFLDGLGAGLDLIGLTFAMFGLPILVLSPTAGRLVDSRGVFWFIVLGSLAPFATGLAYPLIPDPRLAVPLILIEATGFAFLNPALYSVVAASSPPGRSATAQGLFGAAGTLGFIIASLMAGYLAEVDIRYPFYLFAAVMLATFILAMAIGWQVFRRPPAGSRAAMTGV
jgi:DHA1 family multidrug resistance protein-like MFS transporter